MTPLQDKRIYEKAISFIFTLELPCRSHIVSIFNRGSGTSKRIAKWLSYSTLTNQVFQKKVCRIVDYYSINPTLYQNEDDVPPLEGLLDVVESTNVFRIHDNTDYNELWHYVRLLSIALTDVELYNAAERRSVTQEQYGSPVKQKNKNKIVYIHEALERLHGTIRR